MEPGAIRRSLLRLLRSSGEVLPHDTGFPVFRLSIYAAPTLACLASVARLRISTRTVASLTSRPPSTIVGCTLIVGFFAVAVQDRAHRDSIEQGCSWSVSMPDIACQKSPQLPHISP